MPWKSNCVIVGSKEVSNLTVSLKLSPVEDKIHFIFIRLTWRNRAETIRMKKDVITTLFTSSLFDVLSLSDALKTFEWNIFLLS